MAKGTVRFSDYLGTMYVIQRRKTEEHPWRDHIKWRDKDLAQVEYDVLVKGMQTEHNAFAWRLLERVERVIDTTDKDN